MPEASRQGSEKAEYTCLGQVYLPGASRPASENINTEIPKAKHQNSENIVLKMGWKVLEISQDLCRIGRDALKTGFEAMGSNTNQLEHIKTH